MYPLADAIRHAARQLGRSPAFAATVILTLALGTGATTAVFSVADGVLLRPLPFPEPDRLVRIWEANPSKGHERSAVLPGSFGDWTARSRLFESLAVYSAWRALLTNGGSSEYIQNAAVSPSLFSTLRVQPALGRVFLDDERAMVISDRLWRRKFGGDPDVVGKHINFQRFTSYTIVGVMPPGFDFPGEVDAWGILDVTSARRGERTTRQAIGRVRPGVNIEDAASELQGIARQAERDHPETNAGWTVTVQPLLGATVGNLRSSLLVLLAAVGCLLLIGCANVANLLLARMGARSREAAIRTALGATRGRLLADSVFEIALLALSGAAAGCLVAWLLVRALLASAPADIPRLDAVGVNARVLGFALLLSIAVAGVLALFSAWNQTEGGGWEALGQRLRTTRWQSGLRARQLLVAVQVMLTLALLVGAGLLLRTFVSLRRVDIGVRSTGVVVSEVALPIGKFPRRPIPAWSRLSWDRYARFYRDLLEYARRLPGVEGVGGVNTPPVAEEAPWLFTRDIDFKRAATTAKWTIVRHVVTPGYFETLGIPVLRGRGFEPAQENIDDVLGGVNRPREGAALINEAMARRFWPGADPIGQPIALEADSTVTCRRVIGITANAKRSPIDPETPIVYVPYDQFPDYRMTLVFRVRTDAMGPFRAMLSGALRGFEPDLAVSPPVPYADLLGNSIARQRFNLLLLSGFGATGLALAMLGVYAVVAYVLSRRSHEIAIRMALGGAPGSVLRLLVRQSFWPIGAGIIGGLAVSVSFARIVSSELYGVSPIDFATYALMASLLVLLGLLATWVPARRAIAADPITVLKAE